MSKKATSFSLMRWLKRIAIGQAIILNLLILAFIVTVLSGNIFSVVDAMFVQPSYERWTSQWDLLDIQPEHTVMLGDSLIEYGAWQELFPDQQIINRGIVGDRTTGILARLDQVTSGQPARVFLMIGTNDIFNGTPQNEIVTNIMKIIDTIHTASPQTEVYVHSILPREAGFTQRVQSLNNTLETAITGKATWINLYPLFVDEAGESIDDALSNDELHLRGQGYIIWRDAIAPYINNNKVGE